MDRKGMEIFSWVIMTNHVHLVFRSTKQKPAELLRDFKSHTAKEMFNLIANNSAESRKEWLLNAFKKAGAKNASNTNFQFWQQHNKPIELWTPAVIDQKINYIHQNSVVSGLVENDYEYLHSSARDYADMKGFVKIIGEH